MGTVGTTPAKPRITQGLGGSPWPASASGLAPNHLWLPAVGFVVAVVSADLNLGEFVDRSSIAGRVLTNLPDVLLLGVVLVLALQGRARFSVTSTPPQTGFYEKLQNQDWVYLLWLGFVIASMAWSLSATGTLRTALPLVAVWVATLFLCRLPVVYAVRVVVIVAICVAVLSLLMIPLSPDLAYQPSSSTGMPELRGIFNHQLRLGAFTALAVGLLLIARANNDIGAVLTKWRFFNYVGIAILVVVTFLSRARGYVGIAIIAVILTFLLSRRGSRKWITLVAVSLGAIWVVGRLDLILSDLETSYGVDTSLTGRTEIWSKVLGEISERNFFLGYGFDTFRLSAFDYIFGTHYRPNHAHNSYVQALFETGVVGLALIAALVVLQLITAWKSSIRCNAFSYSLFLVLYAAIGSIVGLNYAGKLSALFGIMLLFLAIEARMSSDSDGTPHLLPQVRPRLKSPRRNKLHLTQRHT